MPAPADPRPDDVEIPQWVSRHRGLVSAAPRWIKLNVMRYVDAYGKERLWEWASRTTKGAAAVDAAVVVAVLHSRKTGLRQLVLVEQYVKRALLAAIRRLLRLLRPRASADVAAAAPAAAATPLTKPTPLKGTGRRWTA